LLIVDSGCPVVNNRSWSPCSGRRL